MLYNLKQLNLLTQNSLRVLIYLVLGACIGWTRLVCDLCARSVCSVPLSYSDPSLRSPLGCHVVLSSQPGCSDVSLRTMGTPNHLFSSVCRVLGWTFPCVVCTSSQPCLASVAGPVLFRHHQVKLIRQFEPSVCTVFSLNWPIDLYSFLKRSISKQAL